MYMFMFFMHITMPLNIKHIKNDIELQGAAQARVLTEFQLLEVARQDAGRLESDDDLEVAGLVGPGNGREVALLDRVSVRLDPDLDAGGGCSDTARDAIRRIAQSKVVQPRAWTKIHKRVVDSINFP